MFERIVVGADGYSGGPDALCLAETLAADRAEIVLADAVSPAMPLGRTVLDCYEATLRDDAQAVLERRRPGGDLQVSVETIDGAAPASALRDLAERLDADLIVVGASRPGAAAELATPGTVPIAVAPRGYRCTAAAPRVLGVGFDA